MRKMLVLIGGCNADAVVESLMCDPEHFEVRAVKYDHNDILDPDKCGDYARIILVLLEPVDDREREAFRILTTQNAIPNIRWYVLIPSTANHIVKRIYEFIVGV